MRSNNPGEVHINDVTIDGKDYMNNFTSMVFYQHILSPMMKGFVRINQYSGDQNKLDGKTPSSISFSTPNSPPIKFQMSTNGIKNVTSDQNQRARNFIIDLVSQHAVVNNSTPNYQKSFKNKPISGIIQSILTEGLGMKIPVNITETMGLHGSDYQSIILTQKSPLRHIEDLRRMAISKNNVDGFLMFAGIGKSGGEEFNFKSIYDFIKGDVVANITNKTNYEINSSLGQTMMNNVIEQWLPQQTDAMAKGSSFSQGTTMFDMNKLIAEVPSIASGPARQTAISGTSLNPGKTSGFVMAPYNGLTSTSHVVMEDSRRPSSNKANAGPLTQALIADMTQNFFTIKIPGNSNLKLGQIINYDYRENTDNFLNKDTKFNGKHLISGITHYVGGIADNPRFVTYLDIWNIQTNNGTIS